MEEVAAGGLSAIGLDWNALAFQVVNFVILLWLLKRFAYRPVVNLLEARRQKIAESLRSADEVAQAKATLAILREERLVQVEAEVNKIIAAGKQEAERVVKTASQRARLEGERIRKQAASQVDSERRALRAEVKSEALTLIKHATERLLRQKLDAPADARLIEQTVNELS